MPLLLDNSDEFGGMQIEASVGLFTVFAQNMTGRIEKNDENPSSVSFYKSWPMTSIQP
jgi:hypothetical protein